jgi:hypothetical protein
MCANNFPPQAIITTQTRLQDSHLNKSRISNVLSQQPPLLSSRRSIESSVLQNMRFQLSLSLPKSILQSPIGRLKNIKRRNVAAAAKSTRMPTIRDRSFAPTKTNQGSSNRLPTPAKNTMTGSRTARPTRNACSTVISRTLGKICQLIISRHYYQKRPSREKLMTKTKSYICYRRHLLPDDDTPQATLANHDQNKPSPSQLAHWTQRQMRPLCCIRYLCSSLRRFGSLSSSNSRKSPTSRQEFDMIVRHHFGQRWQGPTSTDGITPSYH